MSESTTHFGEKLHFQIKGSYLIFQSECNHNNNDDTTEEINCEV